MRGAGKGNMAYYGGWGMPTVYEPRPVKRAALAIISGQPYS